MGLKAENILHPAATDFQEDGFWLSSGKPYFHVFVMKSTLKPLYHLAIPAKFNSMLPCSKIPVVLTYCGKKWEMIYYGDSKRKRFDPSWKRFVIDNNLQIGDSCVFELVEFSMANLKFRVQILRDEFPSELLESVNGDTSETPIIID